MKTLTITAAKRNLGSWLKAAASGEDIGIVSGSNIIALRKVEVHSNDYARNEYGATDDEVRTLAEATEKRYARLKKSGKLVTLSDQRLRKMIEKATRNRSGSS